jgi:hypothetical protein
VVGGSAAGLVTESLRQAGESVYLSVAASLRECAIADPATSDQSFSLMTVALQQQ